MGKSGRSITKEYGLYRKTISKYININDVEQTSIYNSSYRFYSYLDFYKEEIIELYLQTNNISEVYRILKKREIKLTYSTLRYYISKINANKTNSESKNKKTIKIKRSEITRYNRRIPNN